MWFMFPEGVESISVEQQQFSAEATEELDGKPRRFFRAPDHFAGRILDLPGFIAKKPTNATLEDLPQADPLRDEAIRQLGAQIEHLKLDNESLRASLAEVAAARDDWKLKALEAQTKLSNLKEFGHEDGPEAAGTDIVSPGNKASKRN